MEVEFLGIAAYIGNAQKGKSITVTILMFNWQQNSLILTLSSASNFLISLERVRCR
jgi:hypothetical protein